VKPNKVLLALGYSARRLTPTFLKPTYIYPIILGVL